MALYSKVYPRATEARKNSLMLKYRRFEAFLSKVTYCNNRWWKPGPQKAILSNTANHCTTKPRLINTIMSYTILIMSSHCTAIVIIAFWFILWDRWILAPLSNHRWPYLFPEGSGWVAERWPRPEHSPPSHTPASCLRGRGLSVVYWCDSTQVGWNNCIPTTFWGRQRE